LKEEGRKERGWDNKFLQEHGGTDILTEAILVMESAMFR